MPEKSTTGQKAGSPRRRLGVVERLLVVGAVAAVLVAVGAWIAMNRPGAGAEAAGAESSVGASGGSSITDGGTGTVELPDPTADGGAPSSSADSGDAAASGGAATGASGSGSGSSGSGDGATGQAGTGTTGGTGSSTGGSSAPLSPTKSFLTALDESGLAPPVDDAQKLAMADDVCQELGYGSTYADVVRALTFAGATDAEAANFATLAIKNICPQYKAG
jgi:Protein of unknown function (DUF732)